MQRCLCASTVLPPHTEFALMGPYLQLYQAASPALAAASGLSQLFSFVPYPRSEMLGTAVTEVVKILLWLPEALCSLARGPSDALPCCWCCLACFVPQERTGIPRRPYLGSQRIKSNGPGALD